MASNFDLIEEETSALDTDHLTQKKNYKHLPFIGFTFTSDKVGGQRYIQYMYVCIVYDVDI